jgi:hypothetical protein
MFKITDGFFVHVNLHIHIVGAKSQASAAHDLLYYDMVLKCVQQPQKVTFRKEMSKILRGKWVKYSISMSLKKEM